MESIYNHRKEAERLIESIKKSSGILESNKELMFKFRDDCLAQNIGLSRIIKCLHVLKNVSVWLNKDFNRCDIDDVKQLVAKIELMDNYSPRTKVDYRGVIKKFFRWASEKGNIIDTSWIKINFKKHNDKLPSELLTEGEIIKMIDSCKSPRDKAIVISLYESGCRIGEFLKIKNKDIVFQEPGCIFIVSGKTGGRRIRLINSEPYLANWLNNHPDKNNPEAFLWTDKCGDMLAYAALSKVLRTIARRAGIKKRIYPHLFRHSRATYLANKLTEQQLKLYFGWTRGSDMASVYVHLSGRDVDSAILKMNGYKSDKEETKNELKSRECSRCGTVNEVTNRFCRLCGFVLDNRTAQEILQKEIEQKDVNRLMDKVLRDPEVMEILAKKLSLMQIEK